MRKGSLGFLTRLRRDIRGNTLAIVGAALVPLTAMIGSGVDMSRAYMARTRLQSACDAGALAARRVMTNDTLTQTVIDEGRRFFDFNFPRQAASGSGSGNEGGGNGNEGPRLYDTEGFQAQVTRPAAGTIRMTANTRIPTTIMRMFGFTTLPLDVTCDASLHFVNTDVMMVLDTTGSMNDFLGGTRKIDALQDAVMALYDALRPTQTQLEANNMRLRYGVVPYSTTVNVGAALRALPNGSSYISNSWTYTTRTPIFATSSSPVRVGNSLTNSECNAYRQDRTPSDSYPATEKTVARPGSGTRRPCDVTTITYTEGSGANFVWWLHEPSVLDTSQYKTGATVRLPSRVPGTNTNATPWNGCIEERDTTTAITGNYGYEIPPEAMDLNINLIPNSPDSRWRPMWAEVMYRPLGGTPSTSDSNAQNFVANADVNERACPTAVRTMQAFTRSQMETYVNSLTPQGYTYHDIGMIWGSRLLSNGGVFGANNPDTFNGMQVVRHIIFMTDGQLDTELDAYTAYGVERYDERITGSGSDSEQYNRHLQRFRMLCNQARGMGFSVWVIAFGTTMSNDMRNCASNPDQARVSSSAPELIEQFRQIGANIGALRLTQ